MNFTSKTIDEIIELAFRTTSLDEMFFLKDYPNVNVRRALVRNHNIDGDIIDYLSRDPVENVSYLASHHPKSKNKDREFFDTRPCVLCDKDEKGLYCVNCTLIDDHRF